MNNLYAWFIPFHKNGLKAEMLLYKIFVFVKTCFWTVKHVILWLNTLLP